MDKKKVVIRITKLAKRHCMIEQRRRFLLIFPVYGRVSPELGLDDFYTSYLTAKSAITKKMKQKGIQVEFKYVSKD